MEPFSPLRLQFSGRGKLLQEKEDVWLVDDDDGGGDVGDFGDDGDLQVEGMVWLVASLKEGRGVLFQGNRALVAILNLVHRVLVSL